LGRGLVTIWPCNLALCLCSDYFCQGRLINELGCAVCQPSSRRLLEISAGLARRVAVRPLPAARIGRQRFKKNSPRSAAPIPVARFALHNQHPRRDLHISRSPISCGASVACIVASTLRGLVPRPHGGECRRVLPALRRARFRRVLKRMQAGSAANA
jgi:hypothetical protein